eukprot:399130_1
MTHKFGPRAIRSNSASFEHILSPNEANTYLLQEQKRISNVETPLNIPDMYRAPISPVFVHPIANPNGNPLDFSHLKTCNVVFSSQSQANNFVKSRGHCNDGIKALHQYEYFKYLKRESMNKA